MNATEKRVAGLMSLAERARDGYDITPELRAILPAIEPEDVAVHWEQCVDAVAHAHDLTGAVLDHTHPILSRIPAEARGGKADELAEQVMLLARGEAECCVAVHDARGGAA